MGLDPRELYLRRAIYHYRLDRSVRILPSFQGTLQKLGIGADGVKTTPLAGEPDLLKGPSPEANKLIQTGVESMYGRFLNIVAAARHKSPADVDKIAQGRVWDGGTAHQIGLVDGFGGMPEAIAKAAALAHLGNERGVRYLEPAKSFSEQLIEFASRTRRTTIARFPATPLAHSYSNRSSSSPAPFPRVRSVLAGPSIQARCLECPAVAPARLDKRDLTLLELLKGWLF